MEDTADTFKLPSLDVKHKFVARKPTQPDPPATPETTTISAETARPPLTEENTSTTSDNAEQTETIISNDDDQPPAEPAPPKPRVRPAQPQCSYVEPKWSAPPCADHHYHIEMLKSGTIVETVADLQTRAYWLIGKLPDNHVVMAHPTVSRHHAVLQFRPDTGERQETASESQTDDAAEPPQPPIADATKPRIESGWYLYDLGSTHGSFVNKRRIPPKTYVRVRVGYMLGFGGSTRRLILQGPEHDAEAESELSITEMKQLRAQKEADAAAEVLRQQEKRAEEERRREAEGASWGMAEDADEETDLSVNPYASTNNEELFLQDPKKTLRGYFEREGLELEYKVDELSAGSFVCKIELPISDSNGRTIVCEVSHKGKKKECVAQGALEACRMLDRHGVLRQSHHESRKRKVEHSDSDGDDDFFDRTGAVERKREEKEAVQQTKAFTYEELMEQERDLLVKLHDCNTRIELYQENERRAKLQAQTEHDLDDFMSQLSGDKFDKTDIRRLRVEAKAIETDHRQLQRLINIARPVDLPALLAPAADGISGVEKKKLALPLFGKRGTFKFTATPANPVAVEAKNPSKPLEETAHAVDEETEVAESAPEPDETKPISPKRRRKSASKSPAKETPVERLDDVVADVAAVTEAAKKKRTRTRVRGERGRDNIDMDEPADLVANSDKYSTWVPPSNQSGDGSTSLNDKFGY